MQGTKFIILFVGNVLYVPYVAGPVVASKPESIDKKFDYFVKINLKVYSFIAISASRLKRPVPAEIYDKGIKTSFKTHNAVEFVFAVALLFTIILINLVDNLCSPSVNVFTREKEFKGLTKPPFVFTEFGST